MSNQTGADPEIKTLKNNIMKFWIARDHYGHLKCFNLKPIRTETRFISMKTDYDWYIPSHFFTDLTFENSPVRVEMNIISEIVEPITSKNNGTN